MTQKPVNRKELSNELEDLLQVTHEVLLCHSSTSTTKIKVCNFGSKYAQGWWVTGGKQLYNWSDKIDIKRSIQGHNSSFADSKLQLESWWHMNSKKYTWGNWNVNGQISCIQHWNIMPCKNERYIQSDLVSRCLQGTSSALKFWSVRCKNYSWLNYEWIRFLPIKIQELPQVS